MQMTLLKYPEEVILALAEAINGKENLIQWFLDNGYPELAAFASAVRGSDEAVQWLLKYGYANLAALDAAISNDIKAYEWLKKHKLFFYIMLADACQGKPLALERLKSNSRTAPFAYFAIKTKNFFDNMTFDYHKKPSSAF